MNPKHIHAFVDMCVVMSRLSNCPRRKFGAMLIDPARTAILGTGYNGGPRGGGKLCGGDRCLRDGLKPEDVTIGDWNHAHLHMDDPRPGVEDDDACLYVKGKRTPFEITSTKAYFRETSSVVDRSWYEDVEKAREKLLAENPPIPSGTRIEIGCHHAEMNVVCNAAASDTNTTGAWLIVTGEPCLMCAKLVHHAGIVKVIVVKGGYVGGDDGPKYLREHGVEVEYVDGPQDPRRET